MTCSFGGLVQQEASSLLVALLFLLPAVQLLLWPADCGRYDAVFESELFMMHHIIATPLLFLLDIDAIYGIGGECFLHLLASGASVLTADQQRFMQFGIARQLRIILPPLAPRCCGWCCRWWRCRACRSRWSRCSGCHRIWCSITSTHSSTYTNAHVNGFTQQRTLFCQLTWQTVYLLDLQGCNCWHVLRGNLVASTGLRFTGSTGRGQHCVPTVFDTLVFRPEF